MTESIPAHQATVPSTGDTSERENYALPKCAEKALGKRGPSAASQSDDGVIHYLLVTRTVPEEFLRPNIWVLSLGGEYFVFKEEKVRPEKF